VGEGVSLCCCIFIGDGVLLLVLLLFIFLSVEGDLAADDKGKGKLNRTGVCLSFAVVEVDKGDALKD
jgi:hypothetical protein